MLSKRLASLDKRIDTLTAERDQLLAEERLKCKHLRLAEFDGSPPHRLCLDCGAHERGWYCGYQVLATADDHSKVPYANERAIFKNLSSETHSMWAFCPDGPSYPVGQSHPFFDKGGLRSYKELTTIVAEEKSEDDDKEEVFA